MLREIFVVFVIGMVLLVSLIVPVDSKISQTKKIQNLIDQQSTVAYGGSGTTFTDFEYAEDGGEGSQRGLDFEASANTKGIVSAYTNSLISNNVFKPKAYGLTGIKQHIGKKKPVTIIGDIFAKHSDPSLGLAESGTYGIIKIIDASNNKLLHYKEKEWDATVCVDEVLMALIDIGAALFAPDLTVVRVIQYLKTFYDVVKFCDELENAGAENKSVDSTCYLGPGDYIIFVGVGAKSLPGLGITVGLNYGEVKGITLLNVDPPNKPHLSGPDTAKPGEMVEFEVTAKDPNDDDIQYKFMWGDGTEDDWSDQLSDKTPFYAHHVYNEPGVYNIKCIVRDSDLMKNQSARKIVITSPPEPFDISIMERSLSKIEIAVGAHDEDDDEVYFYIDWGDGTNTGWLGPYPDLPGICTAKHQYTSSGKYTIKFKVKDPHGAESSWKAKTVQVANRKSLLFNLILILERLINFIKNQQFQIT